LLEFDHETATVRVDWHRYAPDQASAWADRVIEAAYEHGFQRVEFVHGAPDVLARGTPGYGGEPIEGRGQIKDILRKRLYRGHWRRWALDMREGRHDIAEGRMLIALRDNPNPNPRARWPVIPPPAY
jgi:hypothetical protein